MLSISFELPESAFSSFKKTPLELGIEIGSNSCAPVPPARSLHPVRYNFYETGDLSQNKAAEILGVSRKEFLKILSSFKVTVLDYDALSLKKEINNFS